MSHVDDGALHAYLDGALDEYPAAEAVRIREHLDMCAECADRLEAERAIRSEAHGILGLAAPEVEIPSFEELRAYVERTRPKGGGISMRTYRMRMAASVALALGTGWMLRGGLPDGAPQLASESAVEQVDPAEAGRERAGAPAPVGADREAAVPAVASFDAIDGVAGATDASAGASADPGSGGAGGGRQERPVVAQAGLPSAPAAGGGASVGAARPAEAETRGVPDAELRALPGAEMLTADAAVPPAAEELSEKAVEADEAAKRLDEATGVTVGVTADADAVAPDAGAAMTGAASAAGIAAEDAVAADAAPNDVVAALAEPVAPTAADASDTAGVEEEPERRTRSAGPPVTSAMERNAFAARRAAPADVEPVTDVPSLSVAGYDVVSVTSLGQGTAPVGTHVVQRLADGATFEIFHLEPDVSRDVVPMPGSGVGEVEVLTEGGWIVLQGRGSPEELQELLDALFPTG